MMSMMDVYDLVMRVAGFIPALGVIAMCVPKGRNWLIQPAMEMVRENKRAVLKQEIMFLIYAHPEKVEVIEMVYDEYKKMGGNSYVARMVREWREVYANKVIREGIRQG